VLLPVAEGRAESGMSQQALVQRGAAPCITRRRGNHEYDRRHHRDENADDAETEQAVAREHEYLAVHDPIHKVTPVRGEGPIIEHDAAAGRFDATLTDGRGYLAYRVRADGVMDLEYVEVSPALRGKGVASRIVEAACRHAREKHVKVIPTCPYIAWWFRQHPEQQDLLATES